MDQVALSILLQTTDVSPSLYKFLEDNHDISRLQDEVQKAFSGLTTALVEQNRYADILKSTKAFYSTKLDVWQDLEGYCHRQIGKISQIQASKEWVEYVQHFPELKFENTRKFLRELRSLANGRTASSFVEKMDLPLIIGFGLDMTVAGIVFIQLTKTQSRFEFGPFGNTTATEEEVLDFKSVIYDLINTHIKLNEQVSRVFKNNIK